MIFTRWPPRPTNHLRLNRTTTDNRKTGPGLTRYSY